MNDALLFVLGAIFGGGTIGLLRTWAGPTKVYNRDAIRAYGTEWVRAEAYESLRRRLTAKTTFPA